MFIVFQCTLILSGQNRTISVLYAPTDKGTGIRYDRIHDEKGIYGAVCWGSYWFNNGERINNHLKFSAGVVKYVPAMKGKIINLFSIGISYHTYGAVSKEYIPTPDHLFFPLSAEMGVGLIINHFNIGWCYDPLKKEVVVNSGYYF